MEIYHTERMVNIVLLMLFAIFYYNILKTTVCTESTLFSFTKPKLNNMNIIK